ncbi:ketoacyl-ACP synthase III [Desulfovibrio sp. OttesenSCG-928-C06]|nr:ketoacyl-ACP synthase III [Desulfovibrio sp. OttesenSCG-928-C06]
MASSCFSKVKIAGISAVVPSSEIRLEDELEFFGGDIKKANRVTQIVGINKRRIAERGVTAADLCQQAAENMLFGMGIDKASIDALIFVSQTPDYKLPATACILQHKLGLSNACAAFDVNQGCAGYTYGLWLAASLVESGACKRVLLLVGESLSRVIDRDNRIIVPLFGDCGTATLIEKSDAGHPSWFELGTDGSEHEALIVPAGQSRLPLPDSPEEYAALCERIVDGNGTPWRLIRTYMDGEAVFDFTMSVVPKHIAALLESAGKSADDIDYLVLHKANKQIVTAVAARAGFPEEKAPYSTFSEFGNLAGASIPAVICHLLAEKVCNGELNLLLSGYGVGLSWASAVLKLDRIWCSGMRDYVRPEGHQNPDDILAYWQEKLSE